MTWLVGGVLTGISLQGDRGGLEENWDVDLGSIYSLPPSPPPVPASTSSRIWITVAATAVHTWSELGLNMSGGSL